MSDWTPTTEDVLEDYRDARIMGDRDPDAEFDRWLKQVQAEAWDEGKHSGLRQSDWEHGERVAMYLTINPYRQETDA